MWEVDRNMKNNKLQINIASSIAVQVVSIVCAFILPRLILVSFGSSYNGIINSVNQFLSCVTLLRAGIGGVTRAALYKPLAQGDNNKISAIIRATEIFMRKIAMIFVLFLLIFACTYPIFVKEEFSWLFTFSLVVVLGISTVSQYFFGITYQMLLQADQKLYVYNFVQIIGTIANTIASVILINAGYEIRIVKLASAIVFGITPLFLFYYVKYNYNLVKHITPDNSTIKQRWDAFAHQVAAFVTTNTDIMVLTIFSSLYQVSVYSVYNLVISGVKQLVTTCSSAIEAMLGNTIAESDLQKLNSRIETYEWVLNVVSCIALLCSAMLIVPFVMIYTNGVIDTNYEQPIFAYFLCFATFISCVRLPYQNLVEASGHFYQTRNGAIEEAIINVMVSIIFVKNYGCVGVVIGTIVALTIRTIQYANYASKYILKRKLMAYIKRFTVSLISIFVSMVIYVVFELNKIVMQADTYLKWVLHASYIFIIVSVIVILINTIFYKEETKRYISIVLKRFFY